MECDQIGCKEKAAGSFSMGPGTYLKLCEGCLKQYEEDLREDFTKTEK